MLLSGILTVIVLACSGLIVDKYVKDDATAADNEYFREDVLELGIKPQHVLLPSKRKMSE